MSLILNLDIFDVETANYYVLFLFGEFLNFRINVPIYYADCIILVLYELEFCFFIFILETISFNVYFCAIVANFMFIVMFLLKSSSDR